MALGACCVAKFDYPEAREEADDIISFFGGKGSFVRVASGAIDQATGEQAPSISREIEGVISPPVPYKTIEIDGTSVLRSDSYVYFDGEEIEINDTTTINGKTYRAVSVAGAKSVSGTLVYQKVQLRR